MSSVQPSSSGSVNPTVVAVCDGVGRPAPDLLFVPGGAHAGQDGDGATAAHWREAGWPLRSDGTMTMPVGAFLVRSTDRLLLVDCGYGDRRPAAVEGPSLVQNLAQLEVAPSDVTDVVLTHLHIDHFGGATQHGVATFPRAVYRCHRADWRWLMAEQADDESATAAQRDAAATVLGPIADRFECWESAETIAPEIGVIPVGGHTPGSSVVAVGAESTRLLLLGDLVHHPVQLLQQNWRRGPDVDPVTARAAAAEVLAQAVANGTPMVGAHFPYLQPGRVRLDTTGQRRWEVVDTAGETGPDATCAGESVGGSRTPPSDVSRSPAPRTART